MNKQYCSKALFDLYRTFARDLEKLISLPASNISPSIRNYQLDVDKLLTEGCLTYDEAESIKRALDDLAEAAEEEEEKRIRAIKDLTDAMYTLSKAMSRLRMRR